MEQKIKQDAFIPIGKNIRRVRKARNIGQTELVRQLQLLGIDMTRETLVKIERGIHIKCEITSITLNKSSISNTTEKIITNPPTANKVFTPFTTAFPKDTKKPFSSGVFIIFFRFFVKSYLDLFLFSCPYFLNNKPTVIAPK